MKHVRQVNIASYRGLSDVEIGGLADVNVFLGPSNSGKTSALEAVYLASSEHAVCDALRRVIRSRGGAGATSVLSLLPKLDTSGRIDVTLSMDEADRIHMDAPLSVTQDDRYLLAIGFDHGQYRYEFVLKFDPDKADFIDITSDPDDENPAEEVGKVAFVSPAELTDISVYDERYSDAYLSEMLPGLLDALRSVYPLLKDIRPAKVYSDPWMSYVQLSDGVYPMFAMGDGFKAAMVLLSHALSPGLLLLDTPEAFQHAGGLEVLSKSIAEAAGGLGSQVMIATQSLEFLDILLRDCIEHEVNVSVTRFEHKEDGIVTYRPISGYDTLEDRRLIGVDPRR
jgi:predicted ATPase